jgi:serine/threonine protein kinase
MTPERWEKISEILQVVLELDPSLRKAHLDLACMDDPTLRAEIEPYITNYERANDRLDDSELFIHSNLLKSYKNGSYRIVEQLGEGGAGQVYRVHDAGMDRDVALKFLARKLVFDEEQVRRFKDEAKAVYKLNKQRHPNIPLIYSIDEVGGFPFIETEYVEGETLRQRLEKGRLKVDEALKISYQVADALTAAYGADIVHRDIKPENIMLELSGFVKVLDFGIAKLMRTNSDAVDKSAQTWHLTKPGVVLGTVAYMSPEQAFGPQVDSRTDIWSLGVVLYEMLTGRAPFEGQSDADVMISIRDKEPQPLHELNKELPAELQEIINKALAKKKEQRYKTVIEMREALRRLLNELFPSQNKGEAQAVLPSPDAGLKKRGAPLSIRALSFSGSEVFKSIPLDLGMVWGLDRSSFIGALAGYPGDGVYESLQRVERALVDTMNGENLSHSLPTRWWLQIDTSLYPNGPQSADEIWESLLDKNDPRAQYLKNNGLPDLLILGLFFEISLGEFKASDESISTITHWCHELVSGRIKLPQLVIVLHVSGSDLGKSKVIVTRILEKLGELGADVPSEAILINRQPGTSEPSVRQDAGMNPLFRFGIKSQPGFYFCSWVYQALKSATERSEWSGEEEKKYEAVGTQYQKYLDPSKNYEEESLALQVVEDLDLNVADIGEDLDNQFMRLVDQYLPERVYPLIKAYARSKRREARHKALVFAASSDFLMDAWVEGNQLEPGHLPEDSDFIADHQAGPFIQAFTLALLRQYQRGNNRSAIKEYLRQHKNRLLGDLKTLTEVCVGDLPADQFINSFESRKFLLAIRAEMEIEFPLERLKTLDIDEPDAWWLLQALRPSSNRITEILRLESHQRAVFGLCTDKEWQSIRSDKKVERQILICRRQRSISFLHS